jgi:predicted HTH domain antitoxin
MRVTIPDELRQTARLTEAEALLELAVALFEQERLTLAQASRLAGLSRMQFQRVLADRRIPVHYDFLELEADVQTLRELGRL